MLKAAKKISKIEERLDDLEAESAANRVLWLCIATSLSAEDREVFAMAISSAKAQWDSNDSMPDRHKAALTRVTEMIAGGINLAGDYDLE
ncbi:hypothetical protein [Palleronia pelagia]|uniref:Uncharacterized protein n=1 Tax=Palleronia pelagia TaxID=387096 RepID=A0A1H8MMR5_9RHOB|nr:hypothetical protein [Palleronia pelagia]SEO18416.1 hypothetical protein SAMN04488011_1223 [Palleronia pelagia]